MGIRLTAEQVKDYLAVARQGAAKVSDDDEVIGEAAHHAVVQLGRYWDHIADDEQSRRRWVRVVAANHAKRVGAKLHREIPVGGAGSEPPPLYDERDNSRIADLIQRQGAKRRMSSLIAVQVDFQRRWAVLSDEDRTLLHMKYVLGMTSKEIAQQRGRHEAPGTIDNKLTKAKKAARLVFDDMLQEVGAPPARPQKASATPASSAPVLELTPDMGGRWLVETESGSRHLFDLDAFEYARHSQSGKLRKGLDERRPQAIAEVEQWPRVNAAFHLWLKISRRSDLWVGSSYVTRIVPLHTPDGLDIDLPPMTLLEQVVQAPPTNAWLLIGDDASFPTPDELVAQRDPANPDLAEWTCPRQIMRGDLVFIYFIAPRTAVHFAARAMSSPVYETEAEINAAKPIDLHQWWTELTPLIPVPTVPYTQLAQLHDGQLILKGKPRHYLTPTIVEQLVAGFGDLDDEQRLVLQTPTGDPDLPHDPTRMNLENLRRIASGKLRVEEEVERYVAEPLLNLCFPAGAKLGVRKRAKITGAGIADYGIYDDDMLCGVVEVKLGVRRRRDGDLRGSPDVQQAVRYAMAADTPALLIDANTVFLIDRNAAEPSHSFDRQRLTDDHLSTIAALLSGAVTS